MAKKSISIVIPAYNEIESLPELVNQIQAALTDYPKSEIIFIDDGSTDGTVEYLTELGETTPNIHVIIFHRNYGKSAALAEGFKHATGDYIVTMDADLQDDPAEIENLVTKLEEGYDLVSGWKIDRKDPWTKTLPSKVFNFVTRLLTGVKIHDFNCGLKIYRSAVVKTIEVYGGRHRYIPAMAGQKKFKVTEIAVNHRAREFGVTKYGGSRLFHGFFDLLSILFLSRYTQQPMHLFGIFGLLSVLIGSFVEFYVVFLKYAMGSSFQQHVALLLFGVMLIVVGIQFITMGLLGEMIAQSSQGQENRVRKIVNTP
ncbi:MAG: glycosyltransferase family 2 protein [Candidatus Marinimicrobia bacterium]|nr:glycosyltransferase family 2 protein [Candidatus Neomarinimicrobiota bacterium]